MESQVVFYRLSRKIVNNEEAIPEQARQVMYYSLAIGHHVGVMDCLDEVASVPVQVYEQCLAKMPEGAARRKLQGVLDWNEIEINRSHVEQLVPALNELAKDGSEAEGEWVKTLSRGLREMEAEPALYMMVKMRA